MVQEHNGTSYRRGKHFNWEERLILERMIRKKGKDMLTVKQMAIILDRHERSIRRELKRGSVTLQNSDLSEYMTYSVDIGQRKARRKLEAKGPVLKPSILLIFILHIFYHHTIIIHEGFKEGETWG